MQQAGGICNEGVCYLVVVQHADFEEGFEGQFVLERYEGEESGEGDFALVDVVGEDPELARVLLHQCKDLLFLADDLVACCDDGHFPDVSPLGGQVMAKIALELFHYSWVVCERLLL